MATEVRTDRFRGLDPATLIAAYRNVYLSRKVDDKEIQLKRQNKIYFQINSVGHEAVTTAAGMVLKPGYDWFQAYYRDRALCLALGVTPYEMFLQAVGAKDDPVLGRPADALPLGLQAPEPHVQVLVHGHPVSPGGRRGRGRMAHEPDRRARRQGRVPAG